MTRKQCIACQKWFDSHHNAMCCSDECRKARRRGRDIGIDAAPVPTRNCLMCGKTFPALYRRVTCSPECRRAHQRQKWREYWERHPEKIQAQVQARKERRAADPEWAKRLDKRKHERTMSNAKAHARVKRKAREYYHANAEEIQRKRRERLNERMRSMTEEELAALVEKQRSYTRAFRARRRSDPAKVEADLAAYREWKRRKKAGLFATEAAVLLREANQRIEDTSANRAKTCSECGKPLGGKHSSAKVCSPECRKQRTNRLLRPTRIRPCLVCGAPIDSKTSRRLCSPECAAERKRLHARKGRSPRVRKHPPRPAPQPIPESRNCVVCGNEFSPTNTWQVVCPSPECKAQRKRDLMAEQARERKARGEHAAFLRRKREEHRAKMRIYRCVVCDAVLDVQGTDRYTCSPECRKEAMRRKNRRAYENRKLRSEQQGQSNGSEEPRAS